MNETDDLNISTIEGLFQNLSVQPVSKSINFDCDFTKNEWQFQKIERQVKSTRKSLRKKSRKELRKEIRRLKRKIRRLRSNNNEEEYITEPECHVLLNSTSAKSDDRQYVDDVFMDESAMMCNVDCKN